MLCVVIKGPTVEEAFQQIQEALEFADIVELRIDLFDSMAGLERLKIDFSIPMIFKISSVDQFESILPFNPNYIDIDHHLGIDEDLYPHVKLILSHHDFEKTPDLYDIYHEMRKKKGSFYKIACTANSTIDSLRMLQFINETKAIGICMGELGQPTRILGKILGSPITYGALSEDLQTASGQLTVNTLIDTYQFRF
jgi:3-dehydroquinate dehydratase/shikimate dehydrogenase